MVDQLRLYSPRLTPNVVHFSDRHWWILDQLKTQYQLGVCNDEPKLVHDFYIATNATQKDLSILTLQYDMSYLYHVRKLDRVVQKPNIYFYTLKN